MLLGSLNCSAVLQKAALQALRKLQNCSVHLRFRCLCSLLHIWICLQEEQSNCTEKPLNCSAVTSGPAKASKLQCAPAIPVPLQSSPHLDLPARRAEQLHRKAPKLQCSPTKSSTSGPAKASKLQCAAATRVPLQPSSDRLQAGLPAAVCSSGTRLHHWLHRGDLH